MKTTIKICTTALLLLVSFSGFGQSTFEKSLLKQSGKIPVLDLRSSELEGTSYINEDFLPAKLSSADKVYAMRYNAYQDEMEYKNDGNSYYLPKNFNYSVTFTGNNKVYQVYSFEEKGNTKSGFFVVPFSGDKICLLLKEKIEFYEEVPAKSGYQKSKPPKLKREKDKLYMCYKDNTATELPSKKKNILLLFSDAAKDIEDYAKKNKLGFSNNEDLIEIFKYFNSLE